MMGMRFTKMHGCGNAYVYVDARRDEVGDAAGFARQVADSERGIGSDGLILICSGEVGDARMEMYNADGSRGAMCGNGLRCVGKFVLDADSGIGRTWCAADSASSVREQLHAAIEDRSSTLWEAEVYRALAHSIGECLSAEADDVGIRVLNVDTDAGLKRLYGVSHRGSVVSLTADVGPITLDVPPRFCTLSEPPIVERKVEVGGRRYRLTCVDVGSFHAVHFVDDVEAVDLETEGPQLENASFFPDRANIHFVEVLAADRLRLRIWERGSGITLACGTGSCAAVKAAVATHRAENACRVDQPGGSVWVRLGEAELLTGPAEVVCTGDWRDGSPHYD